MRRLACGACLDSGRRPPQGQVDARAWPIAMRLYASRRPPCPSGLPFRRDLCSTIRQPVSGPWRLRQHRPRLPCRFMAWCKAFLPSKRARPAARTRTHPRAERTRAPSPEGAQRAFCTNELHCCTFEPGIHGMAGRCGDTREPEPSPTTPAKRTRAVPTAKDTNDLRDGTREPDIRENTRTNRRGTSEPGKAARPRA